MLEHQRLNQNEIKPLIKTYKMNTLIKMETKNMKSTYTERFDTEQYLLQLWNSKKKNWTIETNKKYSVLLMVAIILYLCMNINEDR